jgi:hypothetical protein
MAGIWDGTAPKAMEAAYFAPHAAREAADWRPEKTGWVAETFGAPQRAAEIALGLLASHFRAGRTAARHHRGRLDGVNRDD